MLQERRWVIATLVKQFLSFCQTKFKLGQKKRWLLRDESSWALPSLTSAQGEKSKNRLNPGGRHCQICGKNRRISRSNSWTWNLSLSRQLLLLSYFSFNTVHFFLRPNQKWLRGFQNTLYDSMHLQIRSVFTFCFANTKLNCIFAIAKQSGLVSQFWLEHCCFYLSEIPSFFLSTKKQGTKFLWLLISELILHLFSWWWTRICLLLPKWFWFPRHLT